MTREPFEASEQEGCDLTCFKIILLATVLRGRLKREAGEESEDFTITQTRGGPDMGCSGGDIAHG